MPCCCFFVTLETSETADRGVGLDVGSRLKPAKLGPSLARKIALVVTAVDFDQFSLCSTGKSCFF